MEYMDDSRKAFHFDLDEGKLKEFYPSESKTGYKAAWGKLQVFLEANGFERTHYSGYESTFGISYVEIYKVFARMEQKFPWFKYCAQVATVTEIGIRYDVLKYFSQKKDDTLLDSEPDRSLHKEVSDIRQAAQALEKATKAEITHEENRSTSR